MDSHNNHHAFLLQCWIIASFLGVEGEESAWYTLFVHAHNYNLGMRLYWTIVFTCFHFQKLSSSAYTSCVSVPMLVRLICYMNK